MCFETLNRDPLISRLCSQSRGLRLAILETKIEQNLKSSHKILKKKLFLQNFYTDEVEEDISGGSIVYLASAGLKEPGCPQSSYCRAGDPVQTGAGVPCRCAEFKGKRGSGAGRKHLISFLQACTLEKRLDQSSPQIRDTERGQKSFSLKNSFIWQQEELRVGVFLYE